MSEQSAPESQLTTFEPPESPPDLRRLVLAQEIIAAIKEDHLLNGVPLNQIAVDLGIERRRVHTEWRKMVARAKAEGVLTDDERFAMKSYILGTYEEIIEQAMKRFGQHAAYGAIALNALAKLFEASGLTPDFQEAENAEGQSLQDRMGKLQAQGRKLSPLAAVALPKPSTGTLGPKTVEKMKRAVDAQFAPIPVETAQKGQVSALVEPRGTP